MIIYVFLNQKLISCDTIIPVCMELKARSPNVHFKFFCSSLEHYDGIVENITLKKALLSVGDLYLLGGLTFNNSRLLRRWSASWQLLIILINLTLQSKWVFHFGMLDTYPFSIIKRFFSHKTVLFESNGRGENQKLREIYNRPVKEKMYTEKYLVGFSDSWLKRLPRNDSCKLPLSVTLPAWNEYLNQEAKNLIEQKHWISAPNDNGPKVYVILGTLGPLQMMRTSFSMVKCLRETIRGIIEVEENARIILKPHVITDTNFLDLILQDFSEADLRICNMHPAIVGRFCDLAICNAYSTAFVDINVQGITTVEYSDYTAKALTSTSNMSVMPQHVDFFINRDYPQLLITLRKIFDSPNRQRLRPSFSERDEKLIKRFSNFLGS